MTTLQRLLQSSQPFASVEQEVLLLLQMAAQRSWEPWTQFLKTVPLTPNQYNVLRILRGAGRAGIRCGEIGKRMITRDPDITRLVDRLIDRGFAERISESGDRRSVRVRITAPGQALLARLDENADQMPRTVLAGLAPAQLEQLKTLLEDLVQLSTGGSTS